MAAAWRQQTERETFLSDIGPLLGLYFAWTNSCKAKVDQVLNKELTEVTNMANLLEKKAERLRKSLEEDDKRLSKVQVMSTRPWNKRRWQKTKSKDGW